MSSDTRTFTPTAYPAGSFLAFDASAPTSYSVQQVDHDLLLNKGTNTHAQIDAFVASKGAAGGLATLDGSSQVPVAQLGNVGSTSAVTTITNRMATVAYVSDYGAVPDGTTDCTTAIQAAIDSGKEVVQFGSGTYVINGSLHYNGTGGITLTGEGRGRTVIQKKASTGGHMLDINGDYQKYDITISDITFDVNLTDSAIHAKYVTRFRVEHCAFLNIPYWGVHLGGADTTTTIVNFDCTFEDCHFDTITQTYEQLLVFNSTNVTIQNCSFANGMPSAIGIGIYQNTSRVRVIGCSFDDLHIGAYYSLSTDDNQFIDCTFEGCDTAIQGANTSDNGAFGQTVSRGMVISGCMFRYVTGLAVRLDRVLGGIVSDCTFSYNLQNSLVIGNGSTYLQVTGCGFYNNNTSATFPASHPAILFQYPSTYYATISDCYFLDDQATPTQEVPIVFDGAGTAAEVRISNCELNAYNSRPVVAAYGSAVIGDHVVVSNCSGVVPGALPANTTAVELVPSVNRPATFSLGLGPGGYNATSTGVNNTAVGHSALKNPTSGGNNTGVGYKALAGGSESCTAVGANALMSNGAGANYNTAVGRDAGTLLASGATHNTTTGYMSLRSATSASFLAAYGSRSLELATGAQSSAFGTYSLRNVTTGTNNVGIGYNCGGVLATGSNNTIVGTGASVDAAAAADRIALGYNASATADGQCALAPAITHIKAAGMTAHADGTATIVAMDASGNIKKTGGSNTTVAQLDTFVASKGQANGLAPLDAASKVPSANLPSASTTAVGGVIGITSASTTALGSGAYNATATGSRNVAIAPSALAAVTSGSDNVAIGSLALSTATTSSTNIAIGSNALKVHDGAIPGVAVGHNALAKSTISQFNTAVGHQALANTVNTNSNTAIGYQALTAATSAVNSTAVGTGALEKATTGTNTALGYRGLWGVTTGADNTGVGASAGLTVTTGARNTCIGYRADTDSATATDRIALGHNAWATADKQFAISSTITHIKAGGLESAADGTGTLLAIDPSGMIRKAAGTTNTISAVDTFVNSKGQANGLATLDASTKVPSAQLPAPTATLPGAMIGATVPRQTILGAGAAPSMYGDAVTYCTAVGTNALAAYQTDTVNLGGATAVGDGAFFSLTTGSNNVALGTGAGSNLTAGTGNTFIGGYADATATTCSNAIALGDNAKADSDGQFAISNAITNIKATGLATAADGAGTLLAIDSSGLIRKAGGTNANVAAIDTFVASKGQANGLATLDATSKVPNDQLPAPTATLPGALLGATETNQTIIGMEAAPDLRGETVGTHNVAVGYQALNAAVGGITTYSNTAVGTFGLSYLTEGATNTGVGYDAGTGLVTGSASTFIGNSAGTTKSDCVHAIALGSGAMADADGQLALSQYVTHVKGLGLTAAADGTGTLLAIDTATGIIRPTAGTNKTVAQIDSFVASAGQPSGLATLDGTGKLTSAQLPASTSYTPPTTKGVIITGNGSTSTNLTVGTNNQVLMADSAQSNGIKWAAYDHVNLTNKGTNTHAQIDTFISSKGQNSGLASLTSTGLLTASQADGFTPRGFVATLSSDVSGANPVSKRLITGWSDWVNTSGIQASGLWTSTRAGTWVCTITTVWPLSGYATGRTLNIELNGTVWANFVVEMNGNFTTSATFTMPLQIYNNSTTVGISWSTSGSGSNSSIQANGTYWSMTWIGQVMVNP